MKECSVCRKMAIEPGDIEDYRRLACYHYRGGEVRGAAAIFSLRPAKQTGISEKRPVGVIVYTRPVGGCELRNIATGNFFAGFDRKTHLALLNENIRCISRVIIEPRHRGLGLAARLVRETMPKMNVPIIEAMAIMGLVNPFFEKAGMKAYKGTIPQRCAELIEAFSVVGIEQDDLVDEEVVQRKLDELRWPAADHACRQAGFIEGRITRFLQSYGKRRDMPAGIERTRFVLSKLTDRPVYYIWFNPKRELGI
jgi:hypothetical protein